MSKDPKICIRFPRGESKDACALLRRYFTEMTRGVCFQRAVQSEENRDAPDRFLESNWNAAHLIYARGMSRNRVLNALLRDPPSALGAIEPDWTLRRNWARARPLVGELLGSLMALPHVGLGNATKLVHQKRPHLVPILDSRIVDLLGTPAWTDVLQVIEVFRDTLHENTMALDKLRIWLLDRGVREGLASLDMARGLSEVRLLDIAGWQARRDDHDGLRPHAPVG